MKKSNFNILPGKNAKMTDLYVFEVVDFKFKVCFLIGRSLKANKGPLIICKLENWFLKV